MSAESVSFGSGPCRALQPGVNHASEDTASQLEAKGGTCHISCLVFTVVPKFSICFTAYRLSGRNPPAPLCWSLPLPFPSCIAQCWRRYTSHIPFLSFLSYIKHMRFC
eukprot:RCo042513